MILLVNHGMGNLDSIAKVLKIIGADYTISNREEDIHKATKLILPGVGHFGKAMDNLHALNLIGPLNQAVLVQKKPILGICLGMQLFAASSEEGDASGLNWITGQVRRLIPADKLRYKIPHAGWNTVTRTKKSSLTENCSEQDEFYFLHAYHFVTSSPEDRLLETTYESTFTSAVARDNIFGVQFHPEKSQTAGLNILRNFATKVN